MDVSLSLVKPVLEYSESTEALRDLLAACKDQQAFARCAKDSSEISSIHSIINSCCQSSSSRYNGLLLLEALLPQCTADVLSKNATQWIQFCLQGMSVEGTAQVAFVVFKLLVKLSENVPDVFRHIASSGIPRFAEQLQQEIKPRAYLSALECLEECMVKHKGTCGLYKKGIERFVYSLLDFYGHQHLEIIWQAARCVALLPQIGGGGVGGGLYKAGWSTQQMSLCRAIHLILDELYAGLNETQGVKFLDGATHLLLDPIKADDLVLAINKQTNRIVGLSACLQAMMIMIYPVSKNVSASAIFGLIRRGLSVNGSAFGGNITTQKSALVLNLPKIHYSLLKLLESLISLCRTNLLPFGRLICKLAIQTLKWTQAADWAYGAEKPFGYLRIQAYTVLKKWCGIAKSASSVADFSQEFVELALCDVHIESDAVSLIGAVNTIPGFQRSKENGKSALTNSRGLSHGGLVLNKIANRDVCTAALQAITTFVMSASSIQATTHKTLQESIVSVLLKVAMDNGKGRPIPYSDPTPRLELHRLLLQLVLDGHTVWPAPINIALEVFSSGLHDQDAQISIFCGMAQSVIEKIIHPSYLPSPPDTQDLDQELEDHVTTRLALTYERNASPEHPEDSDPHETRNASVLAIMEKPGVSSILSDLNLQERGVTVTRIPNSSSVPPDSTADRTPSDVQTSSASSQEKATCSSKPFEELNESSQSVEEPQKMVDLTRSDESDDEISEVPYEVDLSAENDDDDDNRSGISMCSQETVNTPIVSSQRVNVFQYKRPKIEKNQIYPDPAPKGPEVGETHAGSADAQGDGEVARRESVQSESSIAVLDDEVSSDYGERRARAGKTFSEEAKFDGKDIEDLNFSYGF